MTDEQMNGVGKLVFLVGMFAMGTVDLRLFFGYLAVAWLGNAIKEETERTSV